MGEGIADELRGISLGDERLNRRSGKVIEALAANPEASINAAMNGWADTPAAYRLFSNSTVSAEQILEPHRQATQCRISEHPVVLPVRDTTELDDTEHLTRDALCLNREERFGLYHHVQLALTPAHLPLGVIATESFDREPDTLGKRPRQTDVPIEDKASYRWLQGDRRACAPAAQCPRTHIVSVADSEADIYDIFVAAQEQTGPRADYLIRADEDRSTPELNRAIRRRTDHKVRDPVADSPVRTRYTVELSATPKRAARQATLVVRTTNVSFLRVPRKLCENDVGLSFGLSPSPRKAGARRQEKFTPSDLCPSVKSVVHPLRLGCGFPALGHFSDGEVSECPQPPDRHPAQCDLGGRSQWSGRRHGCLLVADDDTADRHRGRPPAGH